MQPIKNIFTREILRRFALLNLGLIILAAGIHFFKAPNHFAFGGTSGISILAAGLVPGINVGTFMFAVNAVLVVLGFLFLGKTSMGATMYSSFALSAYVWLLELVWPMSAPFTSDTLLELCFAVILPAVGSAIIFNLGASSGGTDITAMILAKKTNIEIGKALLLSDLVIAVCSGFLFGVRTGLYCVLGLLAKAFLVDSAIEGINSRKEVTIISQRAEEIKHFIVEELHRSATVYKACGAFSGREEEVLLTILSRRQAMLLRNFIRKTDPDAFITIVNSSETIGKGFRAI